MSQSGNRIWGSVQNSLVCLRNKFRGEKRSYLHIKTELAHSQWIAVCGFYLIPIKSNWRKGGMGPRGRACLTHKALGWIPTLEEGKGKKPWSFRGSCSNIYWEIIWCQDSKTCTIIAVNQKILKIKKITGGGHVGDLGKVGLVWFDHRWSWWWVPELMVLFSLLWCTFDIF
jgi:hypothetical protein